MTSLFDTAVDITLKGYVKADGTGLSTGERQALADHLRSQGLQSRFAVEIQRHTARLPDGSIYVTYSGSGGGERSRDFVIEINGNGGKAGRIGDTDWGKFIEESPNAKAIANEFAMEIRSYAQQNLGGNLQRGGFPLNGDAVKDMMFNYGSKSYILNGKENGAGYFRGFFGDDADPARGFGAVELPEMAGETLNDKTVGANDTVADAIKQDRMYAPTEEAHRHMWRDADGTLNPDRYREGQLNAKFKQVVAGVGQMIADLASKGIDVEGKTLKQIEREFVRAFRADKTKLIQWADYSINRATLTLDALDASADRMPAHIRDAFNKSAQKFRDYIRKPNGSIDRVRAGAGIATGVLSIANLWVEFARRDYDPVRIASYLKVAAKEAIESLPTAALMVGAAAMAGPVGWFALGAVGGYFAIRQVVSNLAESDVLDKTGVTYKIVKQIDDALDAFEGMIGGYLSQAQKALGKGAELGLEYVTGSAIEWTAEESAAWVGDNNDILIGDDLSMLIGSEKNNWLIHRSAGEVFGEAGDDVLIGWLPETIKQGQIVGVEVGAKWGQWKKNASGAWMWQEQSLGAVTARELRTMEAAALEEWKANQQNGLDDPANPQPRPQRIEGVIRAEQDHTLKLDGGAGNDWVITIGGTRATTIGGLGRDNIYNTIAGGVIWGDIENSFRQTDGTRGYVTSQVNARGETVTVVKTVADTGANADTFWFAPGVTIMDAQKNDRLKFYGITLTGGDSVRARASGGCVSAVAASSVVSFAMPGIAAAAGLLKINRSAAGLPLIYFDRFVPWIKYKLEDGAAAGTKDLIIGNVLDSFLTLLGAGSVGAQGNMRVTDYKRGAGVIFSERGDLGLAFEGISISGILAALAALAANDNERGIERLIRRYV